MIEKLIALPLEKQPPDDCAPIVGPMTLAPIQYGDDGEAAPGPEIFGIADIDGEWFAASPYRPGDVLEWDDDSGIFHEPGISGCGDFVVERRLTIQTVECKRNDSGTWEWNITAAEAAGGEG